MVAALCCCGAPGRKFFAARCARQARRKAGQGTGRDHGTGAGKAEAKAQAKAKAMAQASAALLDVLVICTFRLLGSICCCDFVRDRRLPRSRRFL